MRLTFRGKAEFTALDQLADLTAREQAVREAEVSLMREAPAIPGVSLISRVVDFFAGPDPSAPRSGL